MNLMTYNFNLGKVDKTCFIQNLCKTIDKYHNVLRTTLVVSFVHPRLRNNSI